MLLSLVLFPNCGVLSTCTSLHKKKESHNAEEMQNLVQGFIDGLVNCYSMAICTYVVALVNRIYFDEGSKWIK